jgi:hypothetical protein
MVDQILQRRFGLRDRVGPLGPGWERSLWQGRADVGRPDRDPLGCDLQRERACTTPIRGALVDGEPSEVVGNRLDREAFAGQSLTRGTVLLDLLGCPREPARGTIECREWG